MAKRTRRSHYYRTRLDEEIPDTLPASPVILDGWLRLAANILLEAIKQAKRGDLDAVNFLRGDEDAELLECFTEPLGLNPSSVTRWAEGLDLAGRFNMRTS